MLALPLSLPMQGRRVVLIGEGERLMRKLAIVAKTPAKLSVYMPNGSAEQNNDILNGIEAEIFNHWPEISALNDVALMIIAFEDQELALKGAELAKKTHILVNVVDRPDLSQVHIPAIIDRGPLSIGIATGGISPVLARETRRKIEACIPPSETFLAEFAQLLSPILRKNIPDIDERRYVWEAVLNSPSADLARSGKLLEAIDMALEEVKLKSPQTGKVSLVGAGPGDAELMTLKGLRALSEADVVIYDRLVSDGVLDMARRDCTRIYVGKERSNHSVPQDEIHALLVKFANQGKRVVRLKGGDPFIFGRGGEEVAALKKEGIRVEIIAGITAALGCAASLQTALTHRELANCVTFVTGHTKGGDPDNNDLALDWRALSSPHQTLVIYMGVHTASMIRAKLIEHGRDEHTCVLIIENGTLANEISTRTTLLNLAQTLENSPPKGPCLMIIGEVGALRSETSL